MQIIVTTIKINTASLDLDSSMNYRVVIIAKTGHVKLVYSIGR